MPQIKKITLDPTQINNALLSQAEMKALDQFFKNDPGSVLWNKNEKYDYLYQNTHYTFCFTRNLLRRQRKQGKQGDRFEIFDFQDKKIGSGGYSTVYPVSGTIKFVTGKPVLKAGNRRVLKVETRIDEQRKKSIEKEYLNLIHAGHLGVKHPVFAANKSFLIMKKAVGCTLEDLLYAERYRGMLTVVERMEITFAILAAIKSQVIDKKMIHRDLKPLNMLIDMEQFPPKVTIVDYGNAIKDDEQDGHNVGTPSYRSPEAYISSQHYTSKSDAYAAGRILSYLWGDDYKNYYLSHKSKWNEIKAKSTNKLLFSRPGVNLFQKDQEQIRGFLNGLMQDDPLKRTAVDEAIDQFATIDCRKYEIPAIKEYSKSELINYEATLGKGIKAIQNLLLKLSVKGKELRRRGFTDTAQHIERLQNRLSIYTKSFAANPDPVLITKYRRACFKEIDKAKAVLQNNRDAKWLVGEIALAIGLLGVGYCLALGVNYLVTGRLGLFSQTKSDRISEEIKNSIHQLTP